jgi:hypothetical protein
MVIALTGHCVAQLDAAAVDAMRENAIPLPQPVGRHICERLRPLTKS